MEFEERAADPLAGGVQYGYQCGMVWGAALAAGAQAYRLFGTGLQAEAGAMMAAQRMVGACGALGVAVWILGMNLLKEGGEFTFQPPNAVEIIERFEKSSGGEFECSKIAGRKFESIDDHASYLRSGGCSKIIGSLANHI